MKNIILFLFIFSLLTGCDPSSQEQVVQEEEMQNPVSEETKRQHGLVSFHEKGLSIDFNLNEVEIVPEFDLLIGPVNHYALSPSGETLYLSTGQGGGVASFMYHILKDKVYFLGDEVNDIGKWLPDGNFEVTNREHFGEASGTVTGVYRSVSSQTPWVVKEVEKGNIRGYPDGAFGATNNADQAEVTVTPDRPIEYSEKGEITSEYINKAFNYSFAIPVGGSVDTQNMAIYPIEHAKAIEVGIEFEGGGFANLSSMRDVGTFPELKDRLNLTAEEYIQKWWEDNKYDDNHSTDIILPPVFEETVNGITWFGFEVDGAMVHANDTGGRLLSEPMTAMMAKHGDTFYRWRFKSSVKDNVLALLENFAFL